MALGATSAPAQPADKPDSDATPAKAPAQANPKPDPRAPDDPKRIQETIDHSVELLLAKQEDLDRGRKASPDECAEWPYEGVYRVGGKIPIGYRIGDTALTATCLLRVPGYDKDPKRQEAVARAVKFICDQTEHPLMSADDYGGGYDVRGWGYTCALAFFLELKADKAVPDDPKDTAERVESTIKWAIDSLTKTEIKGVGGWNYAHAPGKDSPCPSSPFMTGPTLQALFEARKQGYAVDDGVIKRGLDALERCRGSTGAFSYSADKPTNPDHPEPVPGAVGRMLVGEVTLYLAGRSDQGKIRAALDAFLAHWYWLDKRRAQEGTHVPPYNIAPYYFYYAHYYAAQAIELLPGGTRDRDPETGRPRPDGDRREYRRRLAELLFSVQQPDGSWNDRVFPRTSNYGTSMATMSFLMPHTPVPARLVPAGANGSPTPREK